MPYSRVKMDNSAGSPSSLKEVDNENKMSKQPPPTGKPPSNPHAKRNYMGEKFKQVHEGKVELKVVKAAYVPKPFFFYGSLTDPLLLQEVLQISEPPVLTPAHVVAYKIMLWGQYPALVPQPSEKSIVDGMAYLIETEEQQKMPEHYETDAYRVVGTRITIDGKVVQGRTFEWAGDKEELEEGTWSLEDWKKGVEEEMASHFRPVED
jgi:hypothetical protein